MGGHIFIVVLEAHGPGPTAFVMIPSHFKIKWKFIPPTPL